ncbi:MAG: hypothetical protein WKF57_19355 [Nakamurella sp.]
MARVGWVAARADTATGEPRWLRLSVFDDGWVEVPTFGRAVSAVRGNLRTALLNLAGFAVGLALTWGCLNLAGTTAGAPAVVLRVIGGLLFIATIGTVLVRSFRLSSRQRKNWAADGADLRRLKAAGRLPARAPGAPLWRRATTAEEFASWLTNTTLVRAADVSTVLVTAPSAGDPDQVAEVQLHSGARLSYRSTDRTLGSLLAGFDVRSA